MKTEPNEAVSPITESEPVWSYDGNFSHISSTLLSNGLTKREYFAAMAMQGLLSQSRLETINPEYVSKMAVEEADALIAELNK